MGWPELSQNGYHPGTKFIILQSILSIHCSQGLIEPRESLRCRHRGGGGAKYNRKDREGAPQKGGGMAF